jgi:hypothetical protein
MNLGTYPLVAWGTADDLSTYTQVGTGTLTAGQTDPFGGTAAYLLNDTNVGALGDVTYLRTASTVLHGTEVPVEVFLREGTSPYALVVLWDATASVARVSALLVWNSGAPYVTLGSGTGLSLVAVGGGWYLLRCLSATIVSGNSHQLWLYATSANGAETGTTYFYVRNVALLDTPSAYRRFARPRDGYAAVVSPSGVRDSWSAGDEWVRMARQSWVPATARDTPVAVSGYAGENELTGVNCGVEAMLRTGWTMGTMRWVPDRADCTTYQDVYLTKPGQGWAPDTEGNGDTAFDLELVTPSAPGLVP